MRVEESVIRMIYMLFPALSLKTVSSLSHLCLHINVYTFMSTHICLYANICIYMHIFGIFKDQLIKR